MATAEGLGHLVLNNNEKKGQSAYTLSEAVKQRKVVLVELSRLTERVPTI